MNGRSANPTAHDYKHFLRMRIDSSGRLHIYAIALDRVPRAWKPNAKERYPQLVPAEGELTPRIIDGPIVI